MSSASYCGNCGQWIGAEVQFCVFCGKSVARPAGSRPGQNPDIDARMATVELPSDDNIGEVLEVPRDVASSLRAAIEALPSRDDELTAALGDEAAFSTIGSRMSAGVDALEAPLPNVLEPAFLELASAAVAARRRLAYVYSARALARGLTDTTPNELAILARLQCAALDGWNTGYRDQSEWFEALARGPVWKSSLPETFGSSRGIDSFGSGSVVAFIRDLRGDRLRSQWRAFGGTPGDLALKLTDLPQGFRLDTSSEFGVNSASYTRTRAFGGTVRVSSKCWVSPHWIDAQRGAHRLMGHIMSIEMRMQANPRGVDPLPEELAERFGDWSYAEAGKLNGSNVVSLVIRCGNVVVKWSSTGLRTAESLELARNYIRRLPFAPARWSETTPAVVQLPPQASWTTTITDLDLPTGFTLRDESIQGDGYCERIFAQPSIGFSPAISVVNAMADASRAKETFRTLVSERPKLAEQLGLRAERVLVTPPCETDSEAAAEQYLVDGRRGHWIAARTGNHVFRILSEGVTDFNTTLTLAIRQTEKLIQPTEVCGLRQL